MDLDKSPSLFGRQLLDYKFDKIDCMRKEKKSGKQKTRWLDKIKNFRENYWDNDDKLNTKFSILYCNISLLNIKTCCHLAI